MNKSLLEACRVYLQSVPAISILNAYRLTPRDHVGGIYYYPLGRKDPELKVNVERNQWYFNDNQHGDGATSLGIFLFRFVGSDASEDEIIPRLAGRVAKFSKQTMQHINCKPAPLVATEVVTKPFGMHIGGGFQPGISEEVLKAHCMVAYRVKDWHLENNPEVVRLRELMKRTDDLTSLSEEDRRSIFDNFTAYLAMKNVNGGLQLYHGGISYPIDKPGYCLTGDKDVKPGETCYVYENIADYLALMEMRHKNGTEKIMSPDHHLIINGEENMEAVLDLLHKRCDIMRVETIFPKDDEGRRLYARIREATNKMAVDGSDSYVRQNYFSLAAKVACLADPSLVEAASRKMEQDIAAAMDKYRKEHRDISQQESRQELSGNNHPLKIVLPSFTGKDSLSEAPDRRSGFRR